jgi:ketosteroid isomerase-like protein
MPATLSHRIRDALNAHDIDAFVACFAADYDSQQPAHPDRAFVGNDVVRANWSAILADVPDLRVELLREAAHGDEEWGEWRFSGSRSDGTTMDMRGVIVLGARGDEIAWARLYLELVERGDGIAAAVDEIRGR